MADLEKMLDAVGEAMAARLIAAYSKTMTERLPTLTQAAVLKVNGAAKALVKPNQLVKPNKLVGKPVHRDFSCRAPGCKNKAGPRNGYYCAEHKKLHKKPKKDK